MKLFVSYSHKDKVLVEAFKAHLSPLVRSGEAISWYDRDITAGGELTHEIEKNLASSNVFLAMVSSDYIHSEYCFDKEFEIALQRREEQAITIVPIILRPCAWTKTPLGQFKAIPEDGKPIDEWSNKDRAFTNVVEELFRFVSIQKPEAFTSKAFSGTAMSGIEKPAQRRYKVKREFDEIERSQFRRQTFEQILQTFIDELRILSEQDGVKGELERFDQNGFACTIVNRHVRNGAAHITVYAAAQGHEMGDIYFSYNKRASRNTANGIFYIESDDYELLLKPSLFSLSGDQKRIDGRAAAEMMWNNLLERAGISHA